LTTYLLISIQRKRDLQIGIKQKTENYCYKRAINEREGMCERERSKGRI
jgi:hypothetical protein